MRLAFLGDLMIGRTVGDAIARRGPEYIWGDTLPLLREADLRIANLECPISERGAPQPKSFAFRAPPQAVGALKAAGIDFVSLANNHILDYGKDALSDTLRLLDEAGIAHSGAGMNALEAMKPAFLQRSGLRIGFLSMTDNMPSWRATEKAPGVNHVGLWSMPDRVQSLRLNWFLRPALDGFSELMALIRWKGVLKTLERSLSGARSADFIVLSCHWGPNWRARPLSMFKKFADASLGNGVHVLHGHSAHVFHGIGLVRGRPVLYDTGDFIEDYPVLPLRNDRSFIFFLDMDRQTKAAEKITLVPTFISGCQVNLARGKTASETCSRMEMLCRELGTRTKRDGDTLIIDLGH